MKWHRLVDDDPNSSTLGIDLIILWISYKGYIFLILLLKQQDVSESVCVFVVSLYPNSFETTKPDELTFKGMIPLGMQKVLG